MGCRRAGAEGDEVAAGPKDPELGGHQHCGVLHEHAAPVARARASPGPAMALCMDENGWEQNVWLRGIGLVKGERRRGWEGGNLCGGGGVKVMECGVAERRPLR